MSADEDTELRDLVAHTLESNGVLGKIRAQLRASVFLALEEQESVKNKTPFLNKELKSFVGTHEGRCVAGLVKEFLQFYNLDYTLTVFESESGLGDKYQGRSHLARELDITEGGDSVKKPLLAEVVKHSRTGSNLQNEEADLTKAQIKEAKEKFDFYDDNKNGMLEKNELRQLFCDMFPGFHANMLERYVTDELRSADKDFSQTIDFDEFLHMYRRLFVLCKSVVAGRVVDLVPTTSSCLDVRKMGSNEHLPNGKPAATTSVGHHNNSSSPRSIPNHRRNNPGGDDPDHAPRPNGSGPGSKSGLRPVVGSPRDTAAAANPSVSATSSIDDPFFDEPVPSEKEITFSERDLFTGNESVSSPRSSSPRNGKIPPPTLPKPNLSSRIPRASKSPPPTLPKPSIEKEETKGKDEKPSAGMSSLAGLPSLSGGGGGGMSTLGDLPSFDKKPPPPPPAPANEAKKADIFDSLFADAASSDSLKLSNDSGLDMAKLMGESDEKLKSNSSHSDKGIAKLTAPIKKNEKRGRKPASSNNRQSPPTPDMETGIKEIDKKIADLGFEVPDDSYDEDFESSKSTDGSDNDPTASLDDIDNSKQDDYDPQQNHNSISPYGQTPRSARSNNDVKSIEEDIIEEDLDDDDFSGADDLLKSDPSVKDDLTTDRTVSPAEEGATFDYVEDILP